MMYIYIIKLCNILVYVLNGRTIKAGFSFFELSITRLSFDVDVVI